MTDDVIAIHEVGHAFTAVALGLALSRVQIGDDPRYILDDFGESFRRLDRVRVLMGGGAAEEPIGTGSDDQQIADLLGPDDDEIALRDEVRRFLALNQGTLRYIAARLARRGMLSGDEVEALVRGAKTFPRAERPPWRRGRSRLSACSCCCSGCRTCRCSSASSPTIALAPISHCTCGRRSGRC